MGTTTVRLINNVTLENSTTIDFSKVPLEASVLLLEVCSLVFELSCGSTGKGQQAWIISKTVLYLFAL